MHFVIKTRPVPVNLGGVTKFTEKPSKQYVGGNIHAGAEVFIFFGETDGGRGLSWRGVVQGVTNQDKSTVVAVHSIQEVERYFGNSYLKNVSHGLNDARPISMLAEKLYVHSPYKIAALTDDEAAFLRSHFGPIRDSDQAFTVQSGPGKRPTLNPLSGIEADFEKAERSKIALRTRNLINQDLSVSAIEGMTAERWGKVRLRASWLADTFIRQRDKAGALKCDDCEFDPASRSDLQGIGPRSLLDVHHKAPLEEGVRYTTTADFALLCPTCHRITHARLRLNVAVSA